MMRILTFIIVLAVVAAVFLAYVRYAERRSTFFPYRTIEMTPGMLGLAYKDVYFYTHDKRKVHGWFFPNGEARFTLLFAHGNGGNISHRIEKAAMLRSLGLAVFMFDYGGYGRSEGRPSERAFYADMQAAYEYLTGVLDVRPEDVILYGESLGGAVALELARRADVAAVITEGTLSSVRDMAGVVYPSMPGFLFSKSFAAAEKIKAVGCPKLIIHSRHDDIVPFALGEKLFEVAPPPKKFLEARGSHNAAFIHSADEYMEGVRSFMEGL